MLNTLFLVIALVAQADMPKMSLREVRAARAAGYSKVAVFPVPERAAECSFAVFLRKRFLSGTWSAARRLEAAKLRGDAEEVKRMETALDDFIDGATVLESWK